MSSFMGKLVNALRFLGNLNSDWISNSRKRVHSTLDWDDDDSDFEECEIKIQQPIKRTKYLEEEEPFYRSGSEYIHTRIPLSSHRLASSSLISSNMNKEEKGHNGIFSRSNTNDLSKSKMYTSPPNKENFSRISKYNKQAETEDIKYLGSTTRIPIEITSTPAIDSAFKFSPKLTSTASRELGLISKRKPIKSFRIPISSSDKILDMKKSSIFKPSHSHRQRFSNFSKINNTPLECVRLEEKLQYQQLLQQYTSSDLSNINFSKINMPKKFGGSSMLGGAVVKTKLTEKDTFEKKKFLEQEENNGAIFPIEVEPQKWKNGKRSTPYTSKSKLPPVIDLESERELKIYNDDDDIIITKVIKPPKRERNALENKLLAHEFYSSKVLQEFKAENNERSKYFLDDLEKAKKEQQKSEEQRRMLLFEEDLSNNVSKRLSLLNLQYPQKVIEVSEEEEEILPELTPEMESIIEFAFKGGHPNQVLAEKFNIQITRKDIHTLSGLNWLNDEVINFYMNLLMERGQQENSYPKVYAFNTFFYSKLVKTGYSSVRRWTKKIDIFQYDLLIVPVHLGMHWCLASIDFRNKEIKYYDSMLGDNNKCLQELKSYLESEHKDKKNAIYDGSSLSIENVKDIPQQMNGSDCGMFSCKFAEYLSRDVKITFNQEHMPYFRRRMVYEIVKQKLL